MAKALTVKEEPLTRKQASKIALKLLRIKIQTKQPNRKHGKQLTMVNEVDKQRCLLCDETRCLERAHILPVALYEHLHLEAGTLADIYHHSVWMCPTHHKCYDKYQLSAVEKEVIMRLLDYDYRTLFQITLEAVEILKQPVSEKNKKILDNITNVAWHWWRAYVYGN